MLSAKDYYNYLYHRLIVKNETLFRNCNEKKMVAIPLPDLTFDKLLQLLNIVEDKYGFDMQKMCAPNYNKFILWQHSFPGANTNDILVAIKFVIFCCFVDKILDSPRFTEAKKEAVCKKINIQNFKSKELYQSDIFPEMDILLNDIRSYLFALKRQNSVYLPLILEKMNRAFISEVYMWKNPLLLQESFNRDEFHLLIDKSVEFELVAFLLVSWRSQDSNAANAAQYIATIFWLIDDLCDFVDDIQCKRKNSVLFYNVPTEKVTSLEDRIELAYQNLEQMIILLETCLEKLKLCIDHALYEFVLNEVWEWSSYVRKMAK